jgi:hypothetical protein
MTADIPHFYFANSVGNHYTKRAATVLETPRGPEQPTVEESRMPLDGYAAPCARAQDTSENFAAASTTALVALAARIATSPGHHKALLGTLYETGAVTGDTFAALIRLHGLEAA